jgi:nucleoside-diphosphate-sugar epimerase
MMKRVMITGATGFIGQQTIKCFDPRGYEVHCVTSHKKIDGHDEGVFWHTANLLNEKDRLNLFKTVKPSHLLHLAWNTNPTTYWTSDMNLKWLTASVSMLRSFNEFNGERATFVGTCAEYDWSYGFCSENITPLRPATLYGVCKNSLREVSESFCKQNDISSSWGRVFFLFGPNERRGRLVPSIVLSLLKNARVDVTLGTQMRDFLYSKDVGSALVALLCSNVTGAVNIGSGVPITIHEIADKIGVKLGKSELINYGGIETQKDEPSLILADNRRLDQEVGWKPRYTLDGGLEETIAWWEKNNGES